MTRKGDKWMHAWYTIKPNKVVTQGWQWMHESRMFRKILQPPLAVTSLAMDEATVSRARLIMEAIIVSMCRSELAAKEERFRSTHSLIICHYLHREPQVTHLCNCLKEHLVITINSVNKKHIVDYLNLWDTCETSTRHQGLERPLTSSILNTMHYQLESHCQINPHGTVAIGPNIDFNIPHGKATRFPA